MFIRQVVNEAGFPLFVHAKPHLFSMKNYVFNFILASTAEEYCLLLADSTFTLIEPLCSHSLLYSSSLSGTQVSFYAASCQSIDHHQSRSLIWCIFSLSSSPRVVVVVNQLLAKEVIEVHLFLFVVCVVDRTTGWCALAAGVPSVNNAHAQETCIHPH
jgi:hypothetical protein